MSSRRNFWVFRSIITYCRNTISVLLSTFFIFLFNNLPSPSLLDIATMVNTEAARTAVGIIGNVISIGLFASPIPTFVKILKAKSVEDFKPDPYVATVLNCAMWCFYGLPLVHPDSFLVITINGCGLIIEIIYVTVFFLYSPWSKRRRILIALVIEIIFFACVVFVTLHFFHTTKERSTIIGTVCIVLNVLMYASPLTVMRMVIRTRSVKYMPFTLSVANFCNGVVWMIYALLKFDLFILIPNGLGTFFGLGQLILYASYYRSTQWDRRAREAELFYA
ncbi:bidirectional sugar transporter SWEET5 isoform X2 [Alnus glutinosa]|uniref:bidirectional sugar transporter SWEET5 isoform X2 n=1 Tax=Alnus glutinosa TaxID=3517 RepID=UPI002D796EAB|nr:bidirectional sugar transporter SWEET5 isoform X2 [Alnus glutinosa]